jgi:hypothetical protein
MSTDRIILRKFWMKMLERQWRHSVLWLSGVRRVGKTSLCKGLPDAEYLDCELPRVRRLLDDPQTFLEKRRGRKVVLDEIHRLKNSSEILKIASDHYPDVWILATGSSMLGAS